MRRRRGASGRSLRSVTETFNFEAAPASFCLRSLCFLRFFPSIFIYCRQSYSSRTQFAASELRTTHLICLLLVVGAAASTAAEVRQGGQPGQYRPPTKGFTFRTFGLTWCLTHSCTSSSSSTTTKQSPIFVFLLGVHA